MKLRGIILALLVLLAVVAAVLFLHTVNGEQRAAEAARNELVKQGFKVDFSEFDFSTTAEMRARVAGLTNFSRVMTHAYLTPGQLPGLMTVVGSNAAVVLWKQEKWNSEAGEDLWATLPDILENDRKSLDTASQAMLSGPIRFDLNPAGGSAMLLPHLSIMRNLPSRLGLRAILDLHNKNSAGAWTNVLAATRVVTAWDTEPVEISQLVRFQCVNSIYELTWQALQSDGWSDEQLAQLQREWESVDFFKALPETVAFKRATMIWDVQQERKLPPPTTSMTWQQFIRSPGTALATFNYYRRMMRYRDHGSYEDEKGILLFYGDRENEMKRGIQCQTWPEMREICGTTNHLFYQSPYSSWVQSRMNMRRLATAIQGGGLSLPAVAAEAEARRRILLTAIAMQRYRARHGAYPKTLAELAPEFLQNAPVDFMDGKPLRYRSTDDGHFILYSVGLDGIDNGGTMPQPSEEPAPYLGRGRLGVVRGGNLVWPRPASVDEVKANSAN